MSDEQVHYRAWVSYAEGETDEVLHPEGCRARQTWCPDCGCCEHCYHECRCANATCECSSIVFSNEPTLRTVVDATVNGEVVRVVSESSSGGRSGEAYRVAWDAL